MTEAVHRWPQAQVDNPRRPGSPDQCTVPREEYLDHMSSGGTRDRSSPRSWADRRLKEEWEEQEPTPEELELSTFRYRCAPRGAVPINHRQAGRLCPRVIEETEDDILSCDEYGRTVRLPRALPPSHSPGLPRTRHGRLARGQAWYQFSEARFGEGWEAVARQHLAAGRVVTVNIPAASTSRASSWVMPPSVRRTMSNQS